MRKMKKGLAILLAVLLLLPSASAMAENAADTVSDGSAAVQEEEAAEPNEETGESGEEAEKPDGETEEPGEKAEEPDGTAETPEKETEESDEAVEESEEETAELDEEAEASEEEITVPVEDAEVIYINWGAGKYSIVDEDIYDASLYDDYFAEDGSFTIYVEDNAFFPYEVQFTYGDTVTEEWFMSPDDSIEIGGHTFLIESNADGTVPTQISLSVGGDEIIVYPEKKEFRDVVAAPYSMLPLEEVTLSDIHFEGYTPAELTMVKVNAIFANNELSTADAVVWKYKYDNNDDYTVTAAKDGTFDLSYRTYYNTSTDWEMIVGTADQLDSTNKRYSVEVTITQSGNWLTPVIYTAEREKLDTTRVQYYDYSKDSRRLSTDVDVSSNDISYSDTLYMSLNVNGEIFPSTRYSSVKVFEGQYASASEAVASEKEITNQIWNVENMGQTDAGYPIKAYNSKWITMVTYDNSSNVTGCLPFYLYLGLDSGSSNSEGYLDYSNLTTSTPYIYDDSVVNPNGISYSTTDGCHNITLTLYKEYEADKEYYLRLQFYNGKYEDVNSVYEGQFATETEAIAAGSSNIKGKILNSDSDYAEGYPKDYSNGVYFTLFTTDGTAYQCKITTKTGNISKLDSTLNSSTYVPFTGLVDENGGEVKCYLINPQEDSYGSFNYLTIMVDSDVDITQKLAPTFNAANGITFFSDEKEVASGEDFHDFSTEGAVQYTASSEDKKNQRNYWLQVIQVGTNEENSLYINSLEDENADTASSESVITSTREVQLDNYHDDYHDILLINKGKDISNLSVELSEDATVQLDGYWTLTGENALCKFESSEGNVIPDYSYYSSNSYTVKYSRNLAKIRLKAKENETEVSGTLTIKSGATPLMVLKLTGTIGDIDMLDIAPSDGVKYVPYAFMIQNNNKYESVSVEYSLYSGTLPGGMEIKPNGELYGVPTGTGTFSFYVRMYVRMPDGTGSKYKQFSLTINDNTDANVDASTHENYELEQKIPDYTLGDTLAADSMVIESAGELTEFRDIWLDGVKLTKDTDYTAEKGSTVITILSQSTLDASNTVGTHTIGLEFRTSDDEFHRAAQNYKISEKGGSSTQEGDNSGSSDNAGSGSSSGSSGGSSSSGSGSDSSSSGSSSSESSSSGSSSSGSSSSASGTAAITDGTPVADTDVEMINYTVVSGDTLWKIAQKAYGSGDLWERIYAANTDTISDPNRIYVGQVLRIYLSADNSVITVPNESGTGNVTYYTVVSGDTLWKISKKFYGRGWRWRSIYDANTAVISNPNTLHVGQVLVIPSA